MKHNAKETLDRMTGKDPVLEVESAIRRLSTLAGLSRLTHLDIVEGRRTLAQAVDAVQRMLEGS